MKIIRKWAQVIVLQVAFYVLFVLPVYSQQTQNIPTYHPRLLGSQEYLQQLAAKRSTAYTRMKNVAGQSDESFQHMLSRALVCAIENDVNLGKRAIAAAMKIVQGPIRVGHETFGSDLAYVALVYDLCYPNWQETEKQQFYEYMNKTIDANVKSETAVFHNGWYGYKNWGIGISCLATYYENDRASIYLQGLKKDYIERAAPALTQAGNGGGWAEGYYINYFLYEWLFFCEAAKNCGDSTYFESAPEFYKNRATAGMFESYPGLKEYNTHRPVPMGDGGGRVYGGDRDKALSSRRILVNYFRDDPEHQIVHTFNERTPRSGTGINAYKDFLWRDESVTKGNLDIFRLSHFSPGAGYVYARSSWQDDATYFFFKCGDRYTAHQHLDVGHFLIYKHEELLGDGGHYDSFGSVHDVNYYLRTIAHNTMLIYNPDEKWPSIRAGNVTGNDGGQSHNFPHHNGSVEDMSSWLRNRDLYNLGDILEFRDEGEYLYVVGDCTNAYSPQKMDLFIRQILFIRPGTFIIFDQVTSDNAEFKKTMLLQSMKTPVKQDKNLVINNGKGKLFIQQVLPEKTNIQLFSGTNLYSYNGKSYQPSSNTGVAPECRIEISTVESIKTDFFLTILTTAEANVTEVPQASYVELIDSVSVSINDFRINFSKNGTDMTIKKTISSVDEVYERELGLIDVYPNPVTSIIKIGTNENENSTVNICLYSITGNKLYNTQKEVSLPHEINMSDFNSGAYILKVSSGNKYFMKKIVKR